MYKSSLLHKIIYVFCLQCNQISNAFALKPDLDQLMRNRVSAHWPLQAGYPGLPIKNLNEYIALFSHCLVNINNYQGIEIIGTKSPVYITRFDEANLNACSNTFKWFSQTFNSDDVFRGKLLTKSELNCTILYHKDIKYSDKSTKSRWHCRAQFDLFFPEPGDAPHIVKHSLTTGVEDLFGPSRDFNGAIDGREALSKIIFFVE